MNNTVGKVIEVKVITQYKILGITFAMSSNVPANRPSHEPEGLPSGALARSDAFVKVILEVVLIAELKLLDDLIRFPATLVSILDCIMAH